MIYSYLAHVISLMLAQEEPKHVADYDCLQFSIAQLPISEFCWSQ